MKATCTKDRLLCELTAADDEGGVAAHVASVLVEHVDDAELGHAVLGDRGLARGVDRARPILRRRMKLKWVVRSAGDGR